MFEEFLEYQKLDKSLRDIKRKLMQDESRKRALDLAQSSKNLQSKLLELDRSAKSAMVDFEKCSQNYEKLSSTLVTFQGKDAASLSQDEINDSISKINSIASQLSSMERLLSAQAENVSSIVKNFDYCKKTIVANKQKYLEAKAECESLEKKLSPEIEKIKQDMLSVEKKLDAKMLSHYKTLCGEKTWPVFVPLINNSCGGCTMGLSAALLSKIRENGYIECEQCRRYIYNPQ